MSNLSDDNLARLKIVAFEIASNHQIAVPFETSASLVDSGFTSVAMVDLMLAVERDFDITIPDSEMTAVNFSTMIDLSRLLDKLGDRSRMSLGDGGGLGVLASEINSLSRQIGELPTC